MMHLLQTIATGLDVSHLPNSQINAPTESIIPVIKNLVFGAFGIIAVIVIVLAGMQYVISQGEPQKVAKAKDTIIYAFIGLVVTLLAYSIVSFVVSKTT